MKDYTYFDGGQQPPPDAAPMNGNIQNVLPNLQFTPASGTGGNSHPDPASINEEPIPIRDLVDDDSSLEDEPIVINLYELRKRKVDPHRYLIENYCPRAGIGLLVGRPDGGKSMMARQLALAIITGKTHFQGMPLNVKHRRVIYISTEDDRDQTTYIFNQMMTAEGVVTKETEERLSFIFTETMSPSEICDRLKAELEKGGVDLVIIDGYGDAFDGKDSNSNSQVRKFLDQYYKLATRHKCLLLFLHHINKAAYGEVPSQKNVQGASALSQKSRIIIQLLAPADDDLRYLLVIKGNAVSKEYKKEAIELRFSEADFSFTPTGNKKPKEEFATAAPGKGNSESSQKRNYFLLFEQGETELPHTTLKTRAMAMWGISEATATRDIKELLIKNERGLYTNPYNTFIASGPEALADVGTAEAPTGNDDVTAEPTLPSSASEEAVS